MHRTILVLLPLILCSCAKEEAGPPPAPATPGKIQLKRPDGVLVCKLKVREDGYRIYDGEDTVLGEAKVESDRVKLKDSGDVVQWKIKAKEDGAAEIENDKGERLFRIRQKGGEWRLEDAAKTLLVKVKNKPDGLELRDPEGQTIAKAKQRTGKVALETESGERIHDVTGTTKPLAAMWFAVERFSLAERAAICAYFQDVHR